MADNKPIYKPKDPELKKLLQDGGREDAREDFDKLLRRASQPMKDEPKQHDVKEHQTSDR